jgi:methylenetetrahydrofolate reductase (NADPH)
LSGKIKKFPFSEGSIALETADISEMLVLMNSNKLLTINSQPAVNGISSSDPKFGWGPDNGYVYQKAYFELFVHKDLLTPLVKVLQAHKEMSYQAVNAAGEKV